MCVLSEFNVQYYSHLAARGSVAAVIIGDETKLLSFVIQQNVLSDVYFCDVCLCVVSLPCAKQSDLRQLDFGICLDYFNIGLRSSSFCDSQTIANDVRNAEKKLYFFIGNAFQSQK